MAVTLLKTFLLPPALQLLLLLIAALLWARYKLLSRLLAVFAWLSLCLLSLPVITTSLFAWLEAPYLKPALIDADKPVQAIVVLGGGREANAPEFDGRDQVSHASLWRLRYGSRLAKQYQLPVIVSGGTVYPYEVDSEALLAMQTLQQDFGVEEVWQEDQSRDTWQNAHKTAALLKARELNDGSIGKVILVTHAYHMRRSELAFRQAGLDVIPMATGFFSTANTGYWDAWLPKAKALNGSRVALHEFLGLVFYSLKTLL